MQNTEVATEELRRQIQAHPLYGEIRSIADLRAFMEVHVFAVWDFMSLLKALQRELTCVSVPWVPGRFPESRRLINEIVAGEESDVYLGKSLSHFELYLRGMEELGAETGPVLGMLGRLRAGRSVREALEEPGIPAAAREFVRETFALIDEGKAHVTAAAFTYGREDLIPDMFREMVRGLGMETAGTFHYYLERHIEVDEDSHGPMARQMLAELCGDDPKRWAEANAAAERALRARLRMWDGILGRLEGPTRL